MAFKAPPKILQKVLGFKAFNYKDGKLTLWGNPVFVIPNYIQVFLYQQLLKGCDKNKINKAFFQSAYHQGKVGVKIINERFGYAESLPDKKKLMEFNLGQMEVLGLGSYTLSHLDLKNEMLLVKGKSVIAEEYKRFFGSSPDFVDYWVMGILVGGTEVLLGKKVVAIEQKCIGRGNPFCEFTIRSIDRVDKKDPKYKESLKMVKELKNFKQLGSQIDPYVQLK